MLCRQMSGRSCGGPGGATKSWDLEVNPASGAAGTARVVNDLVNISNKSPISRSSDCMSPKPGSSARMKSAASERLGTLQKQTADRQHHYMNHKSAKS